MKDEVIEIEKTISPSFGTTGWALCVGAGISRPFFPLWNDLAQIYLSEITGGQAPSQTEFELICNRFGPDAVLQGCMNLCGSKANDFTNHLSEILYKQILSQLGVNDQLVLKQMFMSDNISHLSRKVSKEFSVMRDCKFSSTSGYALAKYISDNFETDRRPSEIISLNAEPLFLSMLESFLYDKQLCFLPLGHTPEKQIDAITRGISNYKKDRLKYYFLHGLLPIDTSATTMRKSPDKLVFRESEYINLANNVYSWQSTTFCNIASQKPILFIGLSLSDPNIRKWLTWTQNMRRNDLENMTVMPAGGIKPSSRHFWIEEDPRNEDLKKIYSSLVYHLGIRIIWIDNWVNFPSFLQRILGA